VHADCDPCGMRKQYHFWPAETGPAFDAWDVDRLIELTRDFPVKRVRVDAISEVDTDYWSDSVSGPTVRKLVTHMRFIRDVDPSYPIILGFDGRVMDGMHRICLALLDERDTIDAVQFDEQPRPDYRNCYPDDLPY
jgi:hypothetical protein